MSSLLRWLCAASLALCAVARAALPLAGDDPLAAHLARRANLVRAVPTGPGESGGTPSCAETALYQPNHSIPFVSKRLNCSSYRRFVGDASRAAGRMRSAARCTVTRLHEVAGAPGDAAGVAASAKPANPIPVQRFLLAIGREPDRLSDASGRAARGTMGTRYLECELPSSRQLFS